MSHSARAKFICVSVTKFVFGSEVKLQAVSSNDPKSEDREFWQATPNGLITMTLKSDVAASFAPGQPFYVEFTPAEIE